MSAKWVCALCWAQYPDGWRECPRCGKIAPRPLQFMIHGKPVTQKNSRNIVRVKSKDGERWMSVAPPEVKAWHRGAYLQLKAQANQLGVEGLGDEKHALGTTIIAYLGKGQHLDADNIAAAPLDALQKAGIITNDYWCCPLHIYRERDTANPRIGIWLAPYREDQE